MVAGDCDWKVWFVSVEIELLNWGWLEAIFLDLYSCANCLCDKLLYNIYFSLYYSFLFLLSVQGYPTCFFFFFFSIVWFHYCSWFVCVGLNVVTMDCSFINLFPLHCYWAKVLLLIYFTKPGEKKNFARLFSKRSSNENKSL